MIISNELFFNIVKDWQKKDISTEEKGRFIVAYKESTGKSYRVLEKELGIPHNTLHDWVTGRQMKKYYKEKDEKVAKELNYLLDRIIFVLSKDDLKFDDKTKRLLTQLKSELDKVRL